MSNVIIAADVTHSDEDDVSESSASATSNLQGLGNCVHVQPAVDFRLSNSNSTPRSTLRQVEPVVCCGSSDDLSTPSEGQAAISLETIDVSETTASDVQKQNRVNDIDATKTGNQPLPEHQINHANHVTEDSLLTNDEFFVTEKHTVRLKRFKGIGPTDEATGIPIASRTVSKTYYYYFRFFVLLTFLELIQVRPGHRKNLWGLQQQVF